MSDIIIDEVEKTLNMLYKWQWPVFVGIIKHFQNEYRCFWTAQSIRDINGEYYKELCGWNGSQIKRISWFRMKPEPDPENIPSTMIDVRSSSDLILSAIRKIEYNKEHVLKICQMFRDNFYKTMKDFGNAAEAYLKSQKLEVVPYDRNPYQFNRQNIVKDMTYSYDLIRKWKEETGQPVVYPRYKDLEEEIVVFGPIFSNLSFEIKDTNDLPLSKEILKKLEEQEFDKLTFQESVEAIGHYKLFVSKKDHNKFLREFKKIENQKYTLFEDIANEIFVKIIKKYYSYGTLFTANEQFEEIERNKIQQAFQDEFNNFVYSDLKEMCRFIDVVGIFYKKGFCFLTTKGYQELNSIMRRYYVDSTYYWLCFDPFWINEWKVLLNYQSQPDTLLLGYIFFKNINVRSSMIMNVFDLVKTNLDYDGLEKEVKSIIRKYKKRIKNHEIYF